MRRAPGPAQEQERTRTGQATSGFHPLCPGSGRPSLLRVAEQLIGVHVGPGLTEENELLDGGPLARAAELDRQLNLNESILRTKLMRPEVH